MKSFCPFCEKEYDNLEVQTRHEITTLNGVTAEWQKKYIVCPDCGEELYNGELHDANLRVLYAACKVSDIDKPVEDLCDYVLKLRMENADLHEKLKETEHRAEVAERALVIIAERVLEYAQKAKVTAMTSGGLFSYDKDAQLALLVNDALLKAEQKMARKENNESDF